MSDDATMNTEEAVTSTTAATTTEPVAPTSSGDPTTTSALSPPVVDGSSSSIGDDDETKMTKPTGTTAKATTTANTGMTFDEIYDTSKPLMRPPLTVPQLYARALWDPTPTTTILQQKQLAYALGYPMGWRVERTVTYEEEDQKKKQKKAIIQDRIHAMGGKKLQTLYTWLNHEAAQAAAAELEETGESQLGKTIGTSSSHLLPPKPKYNKNDIIQVLYDDKWWEATITKRQKRGDGFVYSVIYHGDDATQDEIPEKDLRPAEDPSELAVELGFPNDWKATRKGARYILTSPTGDVFTSKKAALKHLKDQQKLLNPKDGDDIPEGDDPPWRTEGHSLIGRQFIWTFEHRASFTRRIKIEQKGTIVGYIDANDKDRDGNPGFVSEKTGKSANLFRVTFPDDPSHPYAKFLFDAKDMEEYEILECGLLPEEENKADQKPAPKAAQSKASSSSRKRRR